MAGDLTCRADALLWSELEPQFTQASGAFRSRKLQNWR